MNHWLLRGLRAALPLLLLLAMAASASAAIQVFTDRGLWEAALHAEPDTDTFEGDTPGSYQTPYLTAHGVLLESMGEPMQLHIIDENPLNGSQGLHYRDFGRQLLWVLPTGSALHAAGFDYVTDGNDWELRVRGQVITLPANTAGFVGVVDDAVPLATFITTCQTGGAEGGLLVDNLSYSDQIWGDLLVFTDRGAWEDYVTAPMAMEDFETDTPGTYDLPYATGYGFALNWLLQPITIQILDELGMNGTQGLHYRDFSGQMQWTFPANVPTAAFGFDYDTDNNPWELHVAGELVVLPPSAIGFIGIVHTTGVMSDFVTTCTGNAQGGLSVDNVTHASGVTAVAPSSISRVKSLYGR